LTFTPNDPWYSCLPSRETRVPCGQGRHIVRWDAGQLRLPEHPDAEAELVLAALGGEKAGCVVLAEAWGRHTSDLSVLAVGPRGPADKIVVSWEDVEAAGQAGQHGGAPALSRLRRPPLRRPAGPPAGPPGAPGPPGPPGPPGGHSGRQQQIQAELERAVERNKDLLSLLALGYDFSVRLAGQVAAAHADPADAKARPAMVAAITGRLALIAEQWLGIDPDQVIVSLHDGPGWAGWGRTELTGRAAGRRLRVSLPPSWLARVWASGLALTAGHLVVAVDRAGWPDARVLAVRAPGREPVLLDVHARRHEGRDGAEDAPHWEV
jgi:hypothetical protein